MSMPTQDKKERIVQIGRGQVRRKQRREQGGGEWWGTVTRIKEEPNQDRGIGQSMLNKIKVTRVWFKRKTNQVK